MNERLSALREKCLRRDFKQYRQDLVLDLAEDFSAKGYSMQKRSAERFIAMLNAEKPVVFPDERIAITRTIKGVPSVYTEQEWKDLNEKYNNFQDYFICNINTDYGTTITKGLKARKAEVLESLEAAKARKDDEAIEMLECILDCIDATVDYARRYREEALRVGNTEIAEIFSVIPENGAQTFHQALQFLRLLNFTIWFNIKYLITFGRFDQYLYPFYKADLEAGRITYDEAYELIVEFFLAVNRDSDLYYGVQVGDNGQSIVLGGCDKDGNDVFNDISMMCIDACRENNLIDPKINLRVNKNTPLDIFVKGSELTKIGLGFPQYCNDDTIIPALLKAGIELEDARNYAVAACWEYTIPYVGMEIPNVDAVNFPKIVNDCIHLYLKDCKTFEEFMAAYEKHFLGEIDRLTKKYDYVHQEPCPWQSFLMTGCVEQGKDFSKCGKYNNYGFHGTGIATGADSIAVVKKLIFEDKTLDAETLIAALDADYEGYTELRNRIINDVPKMGNNDDYVDSIAVYMLKFFADSLEGKKNSRGGCFRAGTGSAQFYMEYSRNMPATADGRRNGAPFSADYSPSLTSVLNGPLSVITSFTKPDLIACNNGGPMSIELHDTVFRNEDGIRKTAMLVKSFIDRGGHQLQLNAVSRDTLLDAQANPEAHKGLIVRVWGWSGHFIQLDKGYQDQIIERTSYNM